MTHTLSVMSPLPSSAGRNRLGQILEPLKARRDTEIDGLLDAEESHAIRGAISKLIERWAAKGREGDHARARDPDIERPEGNRDETGTVGQLRQLPQRGDRTKDSLSLDCFRALPSVPWLKNSFPKDMQTAPDAVVFLFASP